MQFQLLLTIICSWQIVMGQSIESTESNESPEFYETSMSEYPRICNKCICDMEIKSINCSFLRMPNILTEEYFNDLNNDIILETVNFENNNIRDISILPYINIKTKILILKYNRIQAIDAGLFGTLKYLENLDLSHNKLNEIESTIFRGINNGHKYEQLVNLKTLNLANNLITGLYEDSFQFIPNLETLILRENPFRKIGSQTVIAINSITKLKFLDLSRMLLKILPVTLFMNLQQLETINLADNLLETIPQGIGLAINLKKLNLNGNLIRKLGDYSIPDLPNLKELNISNMKYLETVDAQAFYSVPNLVTLWCTYNYKLSTFRIYIGSTVARYTGLSHLKNLHLRSNHLTVIDSVNWQEVEFVDIRSNPLNCKCDNQYEITRYAKKMLDTAPYLRNATLCYQPRNLIGIQVAEIYEHNIDLCAEESIDIRTILALSVATGIASIILIIIVITIIVCKQRCRKNKNDDESLLPNYEHIPS